MNEQDVAVADLPNDPEALLAALAALEQPASGVSLPLLLLTSVLALGLLCAIYLALRAFVSHRRRRAALAWKPLAEARLAALNTRLNEAPMPSAEQVHWLAEASVLARQLALVAQPRSAVAPTSGSPWLAQLDALAGGDHFSTSGAQVIADGPYRPQPSYSQDTLSDVLVALEGLLDGVAQAVSRELAAT